jgi:hypothetical protein
MYTVPQYKIEIRLIDQDGIVEVYPDYDMFLEHMDYWFVENHIVTTLKDWPPNWFLKWRLGEKPNLYIVRDKFGSVFTSTEILEDLKKRNKKKSTLTLWFLKKHDFIYRKTPVPLTGKRRWRFSNFYKIPRHAQERRWNIAHKEYVRGKRHPGYLPDPWDDYPRSDVYDKNWKRNRKTQWK